MIDLKDLSKDDLIRVIAKMKNNVDHFTSSNWECDDETCVFLNDIGSQAIEECNMIGWEITN